MLAYSEQAFNDAQGRQNILRLNKADSGLDPLLNDVACDNSSFGITLPMIVNFGNRDYSAFKAALIETYKHRPGTGPATPDVYYLDMALSYLGPVCKSGLNPDRQAKSVNPMLSRHAVFFGSGQHFPFLNGKGAALKEIYREVSALKAGWAGDESVAASADALEALQSLFSVLPDWSRVPEVTLDEDGTIDVFWKRDRKLFSIGIHGSGRSIVTLSPSSDTLKAKSYSKNELDKLGRVLAIPTIELLVTH